MKIISQKKIDIFHKKRIIELWNSEYPKKLVYSELSEFDEYLNKLSNVEHHFLFIENAIGGWGITFKRDNLTWFAIIIDSKNHSKGFGKFLLSYLKILQNELNGWVIDHENEIKADGTRYNSPIDFYLKNNFDILSNFRIKNEKISAVRVKWNKN